MFDALEVSKLKKSYENPMQLHRNIETLLHDEPKIEIVLFVNVLKLVLFLL